MLDYTEFSPNGINLDNLLRLASDGARVSERRVCEISELVDSAVRFARDLSGNGAGAYEILTLLRDGFSAISTGGEGELALGIAYPLHLRASDRAEVSRLLTERLSRAGIPVSLSELFAEEIGEPSFTYVKNALADEAYDVFTQDISSSRVVYSDSFKSAAEAVASGELTYCLLPLEERGGSRIGPVAELIYRKDLKINSVTPVFGFEGSADMKYALLSSSFAVPRVYPDDDVYLEIRLSGESGELTELLTAAGYLGISPYKICTEFYDTEGETERLYSVVFRKTGGDFGDIAVYLTLFCDSAVAVGMYKNLE